MGCSIAAVKHSTQPKCAGRQRKSVHSRPSITFTDAISRLDLTERQIFQLQQSWKAISRKMEYTGINMFIRIFETHADLKKFFFMVENCSTIAEMRESKGLAKHVLMVMNTLDDTIYNLNDMQYVIDLLYDIGKQHRKFSDFRREFFLSVTEPFLLAVKETLGDRYTRNMATAYRRLIQFVVANIFQGFGDVSIEKKKLADG
ncbi:neuroglobin-1-like [Mytilus californianus]|uniref:NGB n=1 Tax=Mytilus coruscus TaxID=42192 RepID=A0A6J8A4P2_MYTCO|nr:neuroglobin-1-like [Mytilus californianus]CAC5361088.1 NGB [Mytilus coruscus]